MTQIIANRIKCPDGTILHSKHRHDYVSHIQEDGRTYATDGGNDYVRRSAPDREFENLTITTDSSIEDIHEFFVWGRNMDADGNRLPETEYVLLKDITDGHLEALVECTKNGYPPYINEIMIREKEYRDENNT